MSDARIAEAVEILSTPEGRKRAMDAGYNAPALQRVAPGVAIAFELNGGVPAAVEAAAEAMPAADALSLAHVVGEVLRAPEYRRQQVANSDGAQQAAPVVDNPVADYVTPVDFSRITSRIHNEAVEADKARRPGGWPL